jgi:hypothetical protein
MPGRLTLSAICWLPLSNGANGAAFQRNAYARCGQLPGVVSRDAAATAG